MGKRAEIIPGERFGNLVVLEGAGVNERGYTLVKCLCDCGNLTIKNYSELKRKVGGTKTCGDHTKTIYHTAIPNRRIIDVREDGKYERLYSIFNNMKSRCYRTNAKDYARYGGKGIRICDEWRNSFATFKAWALSHGYRDDLTIDRIDFNKDYCPENCRWITPQEQAKNTSRNVYITYKGETHTLTDWQRITGIDQRKISRRLKRGLPLDIVFSPYKLDRYGNEKKPLPKEVSVSNAG